MTRLGTTVLLATAMAVSPALLPAEEDSGQTKAECQTSCSVAEKCCSTAKAAGACCNAKATCCNAAQTVASCCNSTAQTVASSCCNSATQTAASCCKGTTKTVGFCQTTAGKTTSCCCATNAEGACCCTTTAEGKCCCAAQAATAASCTAQTACQAATARNAQPTVLAFEASWCGPCKKMAPVLAKLQREGCPIRRINVDKDKKIAAKFQVSGIPTFVSVVGGCEKERVDGVVSEARIRQLFASAPAVSRCPFHAALASRPTQPSIPGASQAVPLIRATYPIGKEQAEALLVCLTSQSGGDLDYKLKGNNLEVTTTPDKQVSIGRFVQMFLTGSEKAACGKSACAKSASTCQVPLEARAETATAKE